MTLNKYRQNLPNLCEKVSKVKFEKSSLYACNAIKLKRTEVSKLYHLLSTIILTYIFSRSPLYTVCSKISKLPRCNSTHTIKLTEDVKKRIERGHDLCYVISQIQIFQSHVINLVCWPMQCYYADSKSTIVALIPWLADLGHVITTDSETPLS